ncbi:hypothetical protein Golob_022044, partial [Gossypium lobatum]|nr:hypothetical protein [Gossypium lobatum]
RAQISLQDFANAHNVIRAKAGVGPLVWNQTLASYAQNYANKRISDCKMEPSYGPYTVKTLLKAMVVWSKSVNLRCARAKCANGWVFVICSYDTVGNVEGQRPY